MAITKYADYETIDQPTTNLVHAEADYLASENKEIDEAEKLIYTVITFPKLSDNSMKRTGWSAWSVKTEA